MPPQFADRAVAAPSFQDPLLVPFSVSDSRFSDKNINNSQGIPLWVQEQVRLRNTAVTFLMQQFFFFLQGLADIGFPLNGSDGVFINMPTHFMGIPEAR